jgi:uncharacterized membrane protein YhdT
MAFKLDNRSIVGLSIVWLIVAIIIDRYLLKSFTWYSEILVFKNAEFTATSISRKVSWFGLTTAIITPSIITSIVWAIINMIKRKINLNDLFGHLGNILKWIGFVILFIWLGDVIYRIIFKGVLGDWSFTKGFVSVLDNISIKGDLTIFTKYIYTFTYNLGAIVGLIFGFKYLLRKAFWDYVISDAKTKFGFLN